MKFPCICSICFANHQLKVADPSLSRTKAGSNALPNVSSLSKTDQVTTEVASRDTKKRKRAELDESDPKLQEFLGVMLPGGSANKIHNDAVEVTDEPPIKMAAVVLAENESDDEYEAVPARRRKEADRGSRNLDAAPFEDPNSRDGKILDSVAPNITKGSPKPEAIAIEPTGQSIPAAVRAPATDDDWLRSRTNRLLDLVDEDDYIPTGIPSQSAQAPLPTSVEEDNEMAERIEEENLPEPMDVEKPPETETKEPDDAMVDSIRKTSRLFVRNLPYSATEEDLRKHFEKYGNLEEVRRYSFSKLSYQVCMMNPR